MNARFGELRADMQKGFDETKSRLQHIEVRIDVYEQALRTTSPPRRRRPPRPHRRPRRQPLDLHVRASQPERRLTRPGLTGVDFTTDRAELLYMALVNVLRHDSEASDEVNGGGARACVRRAGRRSPRSSSGWRTSLPARRPTWSTPTRAAAGTWVCSAAGRWRSRRRPSGGSPVRCHSRRRGEATASTVLR